MQLRGRRRTRVSVGSGSALARRSGRWRPIFVAATLVGLVGSSLAGSAASQATPVAHGLPHLPGGGHLILLTGPAADSADIYEWDQGASQLQTLTHSPEHQGILTMSASRAGIVDANGAGFGQQVEYRHNGQVTVLADRARERYFNPAISHRGQVAYVTMHYKTRSDPQPSSWSVDVRSKPFTGPVDVLYRQHAQNIAMPTWSDQGDLAFLTPVGLPHRTQHVRIVSADGTVISTVSPLPNLFELNWSADGQWLTETDLHGRSVLYNRDAQTYSAVADGWNALCWQPHGTKFLAVRGSHLGLVDAYNASSVRHLTTLTDTTYMCSWLTRGPS